MDIQEQLKYLDQALETIETKKRITAEEEKSRTIDANRYVSEVRTKQEENIIFKNFPIVVGFNSQVEKSGDYFLHDLTGVPILVVKGKDSQIRAFLNICRHRGVRLLEEMNGTIKRNIVCPYHAWSYDTTGCLKGILHPEGFDSVDASSHSLIELDCHVRAGMIFVVPNPKLKGSFDIDKYLGKMGAELSSFGFNSHVAFHPETRKRACNWKLMMDGALEIYHLKIAHAKTIWPMFFDNLGVFRNLDPHFSVVTPKRSIKKLKEQTRSEWRLRDHCNLINTIFPNTAFLVQPDHAMVMTVFPSGPNEVIAQSALLIPEHPKSEKAIKHWRANEAIFWNAIEEDNDMAILQQKSFMKVPDSVMTVGSYEKFIYEFEELVDKALEGSLKVEDYK